MILGWLKKAYNAYETAAIIIDGKDDEHYSFSFGYAAKAAGILFQETGDLSGVIKSYWSGKTSADSIREENPRQAAHTYAFAGDMVIDIFRETRETQ